MLYILLTNNQTKVQQLTFFEAVDAYMASGVNRKYAESVLRNKECIGSVFELDAHEIPKSNGRLLMMIADRIR